MDGFYCYNVFFGIKLVLFYIGFFEMFGLGLFFF